MFKTGNTDNIVTRVQHILDQYAENPHINVENKDLYLYPDFVKQYSGEDKTVALNSLVVTNGKRFKVINYEEYFNNTGDLNVESCVTGAINYVGLESDSVIYAVTGHGEIETEQFTGFVKQAELANYSFKTVNLLESDIPKDCSILLMTTCYRDYSEDEVQKIKDYLTADGRLMFIASAISRDDHPNMISVLNAYGLDIGKTYIMESDTSNYLQNPVGVIAKQTDHSINKSLKEGRYKVLCYCANGINVLELKKQGLEIEDVLTSSDSSYIKGEGNMSPNFEQGDEKGPFTIAKAVTDSTYTDKSHKTKLMAIGCFYMLYPDADALLVVYGAKGSTMDVTTQLLDGDVVEDENACGPNIIAGVSVAFGLYPATGKLPVNIPVFNSETGTFSDTEMAYERGYGLTYDTPEPKPEPEPKKDTTRPVLKKAVIKSVKIKKKVLTVKLTVKSARLGGGKYQIAYKIKGAKKWKYKYTTKASLKIKKLKKGKKYVVKARVLKKSGKQTYKGKWSKIKVTAKVK